LRETKKIPRAAVLKTVEAILYTFAEDITLELVAFALDRTRDDKSRSTVLIKTVEMIRPSKREPLVVNRTQQTVNSFLNVPMGEVGPETQPAIDVPPLRAIEQPANESGPVVGSDLEREGRVPATTKAVYGEITKAPQDLAALESEYIASEERLGQDLPQRRQDGPVARVKW